MKRSLFLLKLLILPIFLNAQSGSISNIYVSERQDGSALVDIYYTLMGSDSSYYIRVDVSFNNGGNYTSIPSSSLSGNVNGVIPSSNLHIIWNGRNSFSNTYSSQTKIKLIASVILPCGQPMTIAHLAGLVAPVNKTVSYGTVSNVPGEPLKCWITSNLGADQQATSITDPTEAAAGWYWQFNRKQGYKNDGATITPSWTITWIDENSNWVVENDPCSIELGTNWRIPTSSEWSNVDNIGGWTSLVGPWDSELKLHASGNLGYWDGARRWFGASGNFWSNTQGGTTSGSSLNTESPNSYMNDIPKAFGFSLRCIREQ
jgi:hypothetical protein